MSTGAKYSGPNVAVVAQRTTPWRTAGAGWAHDPQRDAGAGDQQDDHADGQVGQWGPRSADVEEEQARRWPGPAAGPCGGWAGGTARTRIQKISAMPTTHVDAVQAGHQEVDLEERASALLVEAAARSAYSASSCLLRRVGLAVLPRLRTCGEAWRGAGRRGRSWRRRRVPALGSTYSGLMAATVAAWPRGRAAGAVLGRRPAGLRRGLGGRGLGGVGLGRPCPAPAPTCSTGAARRTALLRRRAPRP